MAIPKLIVAIFFCLAAGSAAMAQPESNIPVLNGHVNDKSWSELQKGFHLANCNTIGCGTLKALIQSFRSLDQRDFPNSMATKQQSVPTIHRKLAIISLAEHSKETSIQSCRFLTNIVRGVSDSSIVLHATEISTLLNDFDPGCANLVVQNSPRVLDGINISKEAYLLCKARGEPACDQLHRD